MFPNLLQKKCYLSKLFLQEFKITGTNYLYLLLSFGTKSLSLRPAVNLLYRHSAVIFLQLVLIAFAINFMIDNREPATDVANSETRSENGNGHKRSSDDNGALNRSFGSIDMWSIRRNARTFKIHKRIPRL